MDVTHIKGCHYLKIAIFYFRDEVKWMSLKESRKPNEIYINNKELREKVFWRTLESLVSPIQRVHILDGMKVKIADYLCWIEIV